MDRTPESSDVPRSEPRPGNGRRAPGVPPASAGRVSTDPALDEHQKRGVSGAMWIALLLGLLILVLLLVFILQNNLPADFRYLGWTFSLPLGVAMLLAAIAGALVMGLVGSVRLLRLGHRVRRLEKERAELKRALR